MASFGRDFGVRDSVLARDLTTTPIGECAFETAQREETQEGKKPSRLGQGGHTCLRTIINAAFM